MKFRFRKKELLRECDFQDNRIRQISFAVVLPKRINVRDLNETAVISSMNVVDEPMGIERFFKTNSQETYFPRDAKYNGLVLNGVY